MKLNENLSVLFLLEKNKMGRDGTAPLTARITVNGSRAEFSLHFVPATLAHPGAKLRIARQLKNTIRNCSRVARRNQIA